MSEHIEMEIIVSEESKPRNDSPRTVFEADTDHNGNNDEDHHEEIPSSANHQEPQETNVYPNGNDLNEVKITMKRAGSAQPHAHAQAPVDDGFEYSDDGKSFTVIFTAVQVFFIIMYAIFVKYDETVSAQVLFLDPVTETFAPPNQAYQSIYPLFQDVHVMIFIGFGFLMSYLRKYSYGAVGFTFLIGVLCLQWGILTVNFWLRAISEHTPWTKISLTVADLVNGDFAAGAVLISFGAVIGRVTPTQFLIMAFIEVIFYGLNNAIVVHEGLADIGGTYVIHMFGAYFGLAVSRVLSTKRRPQLGWEDNTAQYHSDVFAMIGTLFLWLFWPSFNGALAGDLGNARHRAIINTTLSIAASALVGFIGSRFLRSDLKFNMTDIQNATLAGGVAMGAVSNMIPNPWGALFIGACAGFLSVYGFNRIQRFLELKFQLHDTCGINNLHGMPSIFGAFCSVFVTGVSTHAQFGDAYTAVYWKGRNWTDQQQALVQLYCIFITLAIALASGLATGLLLRSQLFNHLSPLYNDETVWEAPVSEEPRAANKPRAVARHRTQVKKTQPPKQTPK